MPAAALGSENCKSGDGERGAGKSSVATRLPPPLMLEQLKMTFGLECVGVIGSAIRGKTGQVVGRHGLPFQLRRGGCFVFPFFPSAFR